ncbi:MAG: hypothetical protein LC781_17155 [Actinobacteria bacterium]|nr:hypothetical protein [Actinomycetota bacterium]
MKPDEKAFEEHIAGSLVEGGGYRDVKLGNASGDFDAGRGLDLAELFAFIEVTQGGEWGRLAKLHGGEARARERFADRLAKELGERGTVDVLRHGVVDLGVRIRLAFFKPAHGLTPELVARYDANRLTVTRQLPYEVGTNKTLDLALFVNGVPVATAELKNLGDTPRHPAAWPTGGLERSPGSAQSQIASGWYGRRTPGSTCSDGSSTSRGRRRGRGPLGP